MAGSPVPVSGPSPFATCDIAYQPGANYFNSAVQPWIDVSPANPSRMIGVWQQDHWSTGGARSLLTAYSADSGQKWKRVAVPGINKCSGGKRDFAYDRSSDPWVAVSPNGTAYLLTVSFNNPAPDDRFGPSAMLVSRSTTGGASWGKPTPLYRDDGSFEINRNGAIAADPRDSRYVYATWELYYDETGTGVDGSVDEPQEPAGPLPGRLQPVRKHGAAWKAGPRTTEEGYFTGSIYFARTVNGGKGWDAGRKIYDPGKNARSSGAQPVVLNDGSILIFYMETFATGERRIRFLRSTDRGASFSAPIDAASTVGSGAGTFTPDTHEPVSDASNLFDVAVDRLSGRLYLVWQDSRQDGITRIAFSMSSDGGASWSAPAMISKSPANANPLRSQAFVPSVEVAADSRVYVTYYDFRNDPAPSPASELADYWATGCQPLFSDCRLPAEWTYETRLTASSFEMLNAPKSGPAYFLGDYQGLVKQGTGVRTFFAIPTTQGQTSVVTNLFR